MAVWQDANEKIQIVPLESSESDGAAEAAGRFFGAIIAGVEFGVGLVIILTISYIIPIINIPALIIAHIMEAMNLGYFQAAIFGVIMCGVVSAAMLPPDSNSPEGLEGRLKAVNFRKTCGNESSCKNCAYHNSYGVVEDDPEYPNARFVCQQYSFLFKGAERINDLKAFTCDNNRDLIKELVETMKK